MSTEHSKRAARFTQDVEKTAWHDATFWSVRQKRDKMAQELPEWESLREHASQIKMHTITHLADYLDMFSKNLESRGVIVHWAKDAQEFNEIVLGILKDHNVKKMVKSKSMLTEECEMNLTWSSTASTWWRPTWVSASSSSWGRSLAIS